jgi:hypothetical protein
LVSGGQPRAGLDDGDLARDGDLPRAGRGLDSVASVADPGGTESRDQRAEGGGRSTNPGRTKEAAARRSDSEEQEGGDRSGRAAAGRPVGGWRRAAPRGGWGRRSGRCLAATWRRSGRTAAEVEAAEVGTADGGRGRGSSARKMVSSARKMVGRSRWW